MKKSNVKYKRKTQHRKTNPAPYLVLNIICPLIVLGTSKSIWMSYVEGLSNVSLYSVASASYPLGVIPECRDIKRSQAARRHRSGMPLYVRSRNFPSFDGRMSQFSTLPPCSRFSGTSIRFHLAILEASFGGTIAGGRVLTALAVGVAVGGPAPTVDTFLRSGAAVRRTSRSCEVIEKKPNLISQTRMNTCRKTF